LNTNRIVVALGKQELELDPELASVGFGDSTTFGATKSCRLEKSLRNHHLATLLRDRLGMLDFRQHTRKGISAGKVTASQAVTGTG
jgi:hypothetical protein